MSIRLIAIELYQLQKEMSELEKRILTAPEEEMDALKEKLRQVKAGHIRMRRVLDGRIDRPKRPLR